MGLHLAIFKLSEALSIGNDGINVQLNDGVDSVRGESFFIFIFLLILNGWPHLFLQVGDVCAIRVFPEALAVFGRVNVLSEGEVPLGSQNSRPCKPYSIFGDWQPWGASTLINKHQRKAIDSNYPEVELTI